MKPLRRAFPFITAALSAVVMSGCDRARPNQPPQINRLAKIETRAVIGPDGPTHGILVAVDAPDAATFGDLMPHIVTTIKNQRINSPPNTSFLLITVIGAVSASDFQRHWEANTVDDKVVQDFLSQMTKAEVLHGTPDGKSLDSASLRK